MGSASDYVVSEQRDPDLVDAQRRGPRDLIDALNARCECGHSRRDHMAATGALGSFGGTACEQCWTCPTFRPERG